MCQCDCQFHGPGKRFLISVILSTVCCSVDIPGGIPPDKSCNTEDACLNPQSSSAGIAFRYMFSNPSSNVNKTSPVFTGQLNCFRDAAEREFFFNSARRDLNRSRNTETYSFGVYQYRMEQKPWLSAGMSLVPKQRCHPSQKDRPQENA